MARILIVDDQDMMRDSLAQILVREGHEVVAAVDGASAVARLGPARFDLLITDLRMPKMSGLELMAEAKRLRPDMPVVLMTAFATVSNAVEAMKLGAYDYIQKPFNGDEIKLLVDRTLEHSRLRLENQAYRSMTDIGSPRPLVGDGPAMEQVRQKIELVSRSNATVLIRGESGTGKEIVARAIHLASARRERPMLAVNCAALSENLLESELFGHEKGAFTGADKLRRGRFELADGGTLLLDEISEIAPALQAKLLRVLQENCFERVGSSLTQQVDVRVIATTNRNLDQCVEEGDFRRDLFYRLNVVPIEIPPLRNRLEDIPELCRHFIHQASKRETHGVPAHRAGGPLPFAAVRLAGQRARIAEHHRAGGGFGKRAGRDPGPDHRAVAQAASRGPRCRGIGGPAAGGDRKAGHPQHASAVQRPSRSHRQRAGHRRANPGNEAEAVARGRRIGRSHRS